jgi:hypothetical protein
VTAPNPTPPRTVLTVLTVLLAHLLARRAGLLDLAGLGALVGAGFTWNITAGLAALGTALIVLAART